MFFTRFITKALAIIDQGLSDNTGVAIIDQGLSDNAGEKRLYIVNIWCFSRFVAVEVNFLVIPFKCNNVI